VSAMQSEHEETAHAEREALQADQTHILEEIRGLSEEVRALREQMTAGYDRRKPS